MAGEKDESSKKPTYVAAPDVPPELEQRYRLVLMAVSGQLPVAEAARQLGMSRNHFQTLMHKGLGALLDSLQPRSGGRPPRPVREAELEKELERLRKENARLKQKTEMVDRLLGVASGLMRGRTTAKREAKPDEESGTGDKEEPDGRRLLLEEARRMRSLGLSMVLAAAVVGVSPPTLRRWAGRARTSVREALPVIRRDTTPEIAARVEDLVRETRGLVGAESLRRSIPGISRRQAQAVKADALIQMERERKERTGQVLVAAPGIIRGFDQMYVPTLEGMRYLLISSDAAVPYRTSAPLVQSYDSAAVVAAMEADLRDNGAPLVLRLDRASVHRTPEVKKLLDDHGVLVLHGPPRHPRYYGQLERQNRDHRAWLNQLGVVHELELEQHVGQMIGALNGQWRRRSLGWRTPAEAWAERPKLRENRIELRAEVRERAERMQRDTELRGLAADLAERLAIEQALIQRGYLRLEVGGWC